MKPGDLVNHIMKRGWGIGVVVGIRTRSMDQRRARNLVYNVAWQSIGTIGWAWDYDLEVLSEGRQPGKGKT